MSCCHSNERRSTLKVSLTKQICQDTRPATYSKDLKKKKKDYFNLNFLAILIAPEVQPFYHEKYISACLHALFLCWKKKPRCFFLITGNGIHVKNCCGLEYLDRNLACIEWQTNKGLWYRSIKSAETIRTFKVYSVRSHYRAPERDIMKSIIWCGDLQRFL